MADINQVQLPDGSQYNIKDDTSGYASEAYVQGQISGITKATIGLGNVDNTSDLNKPVSTAQQTALDGKVNTSMVATVQTTLTANKRYVVGDEFIYQGNLYKATAIIPNGDSIVINTNAVLADDISTQIGNANTAIGTLNTTVAGKADKADLTSISETGSTASRAISAGTYFYLNGTLVRAKTDIASGATFTLNTNYEVVSDGALNLTNNAIILWGGNVGTIDTVIQLSDSINNYSLIVIECGIAGDGDTNGYFDIPIAKPVVNKSYDGGITFVIGGNIYNQLVQALIVDNTHIKYANGLSNTYAVIPSINRIIGYK